MTFEEFFNKKRIDLVALQSGEPALFSEFKKHFEQMGEKSFDHTKKYWFNKLRLQYHLAPELKPEKMHIENKLAEQTITEALSEEKIPAPSVGFKPRFKPGMGSKPVASTSDIKDQAPESSATATPEVNEAAATKEQHPPFEQEKEAMQAKADAMPRTTDNEAAAKPPENPAAKPAGFKPRFNMKMAAPKTEQAATPEAKPEETQNTTEPEANPAETAAPKPAGFKPRFNMKMVAPKPVESEEPKAEAEQPAEPEAKTPEPAAPEEITPPKPAYKPKFNMKNIKPKPPEE
ncbi:hypothetical protein [Mucilaginibacter sp.]|jgi:hypothetical protein|uniref:hypothetical protein n=1 Tax=Mucilaginibacter sp. TaxID=1882438 RepID=UPI0035630D52